MTDDCKNVRNLINIEDELTTFQLIEKIKKGEYVTLSICSNQSKGKTLVWDDKEILTFDVCRCGNSEHNTIVILRDMLKIYYPEDKWTYPKVQNFVSFSSKREI